MTVASLIWASCIRIDARTAGDRGVSRRYEQSEAIRREGHYRRLGTRNPRCSVCGLTGCGPAMFAGRVPSITCLQCVARLAGRIPIEQHHLAGASNDPATVPTPGNGHAFVTDAQRDWPPDTLRNPRDSPLRWAAAWFRGCLELLAMLIALAGAVPPVIELVDELLTDALGERWWEAIGFRWIDQ